MGDDYAEERDLCKEIIWDRKLFNRKEPEWTAYFWLLYPIRNGFAKRIRITEKDLRVFPELTGCQFVKLSANGDGLIHTTLY